MLLRTALLAALALATTARHSPPRLLLYTPLHVSEPTSAVRDFAACLFGKQPSLRGLKFDMLVAVSGAQPDGRQEELKRIIADASGSANVDVSFTQLKDDTYALSLSNDHRKGEQWVSGPNDAFYGAMLNGPIYQTYVRHYDFVQQLETDVCAMTDGWLDVLVDPMLRDARLLISGARTACDCVYDAIHDVCEPISKHGDHMLAHVNGNAVYRVGTELKNVLAKAQIKYGNTEPFDLAVYWTMKEAGMLSRLHINPRYLNTPCLIDRARFTSPSYHATPDAVAIHAPRRLRTTSVQAVASRGLNRDKQAQRKLHTLTVVALTQVDVDVLKNQRAAFACQFVKGVVYVAANQATFNAASRIAPLQVVAAFDGSDVDYPKTTANAATANHHAPMPSYESWPPSTSSAGTLLTAVARILALGHDVFLVGADAVPLANYGGKLAALDRGQVHVAGVGADVPSMAYLPSSAAVASFVNAWALDLRDGQRSTYDALAATAHHHAITLTPLPWSDFIMGGPLLTSGWPGNTLKRRAVVAVGGRDAASTTFRLRAARVWPHADGRIPCANYSVLSRRPVNLTSESVARVIARHAEFAAFVAAENVACVVVMGFALPATRSRVDIGSLIDFAAFARACGNVTLLPSRRWIPPGARRIKFVPRHGRWGVTPPPLPLAHPLDSAVQSASVRLGPSFVCVRDPHRSPDEVASLTLGGGIDSWMTALRQHHRIASHHKLLLTGAWKAVRAADISASAANVLTLADVTGDNAHRILAPTLASTPANLLLDPAWADVVEGLLCSWHAASTVHAQPAFPPPQALDAIITTIVPHIPASLLRRDLDVLQHWLSRSDRLKMLPPLIAVLGSPSSTTLRTLHTLADVQSSRPVVLPFSGQAWPDAAYAPANILPPSVLALTLPRLAPVLATQGALTPAPDTQSALSATEFRTELALIKHLARKWAKSVLWTAPGNATLTDVLDAVRAVPRGDGVLVFA